MQSSGLRGRRLPGAGDVAGLGSRLTFLFGVLLALSALTGWYTGEGNGTTVSVIVCRAAFASPGEEAMTRSTSAVAVCCSSASVTWRLLS